MLSVIGNSHDAIGPRIVAWYEAQGNSRVFGPYAAIGFLSPNGEIKGAVILINYQHEANIEAHVYVPRVITKANIKRVYKFVFEELKCTRLTAIPKRSNKKLLKILPKMSFTFNGVLPRYYGKDKKDDGIAYGLMPENAKKWMK